MSIRFSQLSLHDARRVNVETSSIGKHIGDGIKKGFGETAKVIKGAGDGTGLVTGAAAQGAAYTAGKAVTGFFSGMSKARADTKCESAIANLRTDVTNTNYQRRVMQMDAACAKATDRHCDALNDTIHAVSGMDGHKKTFEFLFGKSISPEEYMKKSIQYNACQPPRPK